MDNLEFAIGLLREAQEEKIRLAKYEKEYKGLPSYGDPDYSDKANKFWSKWTTIPKKSVIKDNLKMARRLILKEFKEVN